MNQNNLVRTTPWLIGASLSFLAVVAWGQGISWDLGAVSVYTFFPLLGILAFSLMLSHYAYAEARRFAPKLPQAKRYFQLTGWVVLLCILLHPALLAFTQWQNDRGLPPNSFYRYVGTAQKGSVIFGSIALFCFLLYELKTFAEKKSWWRYIVVTNHVAMVLVFFHGLRLGAHLQSGWYQVLWLLYGLVLIISIVHGESDRRHQKHQELTIS